MYQAQLIRFRAFWLTYSAPSVRKSLSENHPLDYFVFVCKLTPSFILSKIIFVRLGALFMYLLFMPIFLCQSNKRSLIPPFIISLYKRLMLLRDCILNVIIFNGCHVASFLSFRSHFPVILENLPKK